jgi:YbgC/YbaW family acyl-CoA thioester hydrolase
VPTEYRLKRRVNFYETDAAGIVHFSTFLRYMEEAEHAMWRESGLSIAARGSDIGWPRVAVTFDFFRPLRFEDEFEVLIRIEEVAEKRIRYGCTITLGGEKCASGTMTIACVRRRAGEPMKSMAIPEDIVTRLHAVMEGGSALS